MSPCRLLFFLWIGVGGATAGPLDPAWRDASNLLFNQAHQQFQRAAKKEGAAERERMLGHGITLLNLQPRTQSNLEEARALFQRLMAQAPESGEARFAAFYLARLYELYDHPAQPDQARRLYRQLLEDHPGDLLAERSASCLVLLDLYETISDEERTRRFHALESWASRLRTPTGRRDFSLNMGYACLDFPAIEASRARAIHYLLAAEKEGITQHQMEARTWIAIGELARLEGRKELAREYYQKFLTKYRRDNRHYTLQKRLETL
ncbi:MAG TPA: tetratricopeptide repeat protein [Chthoniobacteraceae bacterium]|nr:tetratricopeptide repeat protein [Chthoniobacteraceae bacterium]